MRLAPVFPLAIAIGLCAWDLAPAAQAVPAAGVRQLPERLQDGEFWRLVTDLSETGGAYHSDNHVERSPASPTSPNWQPPGRGAPICRS
jgi:hypothetical protein